MLQAVARPGSLAETHSILLSRDGAMIIAGGTVVMPILNYGTDAFDALVSLRAKEPSLIWKSARGVYAVDDTAMIRWYEGHAKAGTWPPKGIETFDPWHLPLLNTLLLLTSGTTVTWAHHALLENDRQAVTQVWRRFHTRIAQDASARADYVDSVAQYGRHQTLKGLEAALNKRVPPNFRG